MINEIVAKSILRKQKCVDSWFISSCGMNLYRGCTHNCSYCDGRAEKYNVEGEFGKNVEVKINAIEILEQELNPSNKRIPLRKGFVLLGGGVCDAYQPIENKYFLSGRTLELIEKYKYPVHILTKSTLVLRDLEIISKINKQSKAIISFSFSSCNDIVSKIFEPGVPSPSERLDAIKKIKEQGINCGMFLIPVIPYITDTDEFLEESISKAKEAGIDFIIFGGMTLKEGKQKQHFINTLSGFNPELVKAYQGIYPPSKWGNASNEYYSSINKKYISLIKKYHIPVRVPFYLYSDILSENDKIIVMLEHLHYIHQLKGEDSFFGLAARSISELKIPVSEIINTLTSLKGIGHFTEKIILEIIKTGDSKYFREKMNI